MSQNKRHGFVLDFAVVKIWQGSNGPIMRHCSSWDLYTLSVLKNDLNVTCKEYAFEMKSLHSLHVLEFFGFHGKSV